jgi:hypothetical protein
MPRRSAQPQITSEKEDSAGMSLYTVVRHPRVHAQVPQAPQVDDEHIGFNGKVAAWITTQIGSMWTVYACSAFCAVWILLAQLQARLKAQDLAIRHIVEHMNECRPKAAAGQAS